MILRWHRALTADDVATARQLRELHMPGEADVLGRRKCVSALHLILAPPWPCAPAEWCEAVLAADANGDVPGADASGEVPGAVT